MARVEFQASLDALEATLQEQGAVVLRALRGAINVLDSQDAELCDEVVAFDDEIDSRYHRIEKSVEELLAQQSPGRDAISASCSRSCTTRSTSSGSATSASRSRS